MIVESLKRLARAREPQFDCPGPPDKGVLGNAAEFQTDQVGFFERMLKDYGPIARFRVLFDNWYLVNDPAMVYDILVKRQNLFHKPRVNKEIFKDFMGNGLVSNDGAHWKRQHRMIIPGFHRKRINAYADTMVNFTRKMIDEWQPGSCTDINEDLTGLTLMIIAKTMFGANVDGDRGTFRDSMEDINEVLVEYINLPLPVPTWWPSHTNRRKVQAIRNVEKILADIVAERRRTGKDHGDVLSMMIFAKDETGAGMTEKELRDEGMTLFFAGHETVAHSMTWMWHLLATHQHVTRKIQEELDEVTGGRPLTLDDVPKLTYLEMAIKESLRYHSAVWVYMRENIEDITLGDVRIPKGSFLVVAPRILHRQSSIYEDADQFIPERFTKEGEAKIPKGGYVPFALGSRICLGRTFALLEMRLVMGTILQRFTPNLPPGFKPIPQPQLSLNPANGMPNIVTPRVRFGRREAAE